jgi:adenylyl-sulfate kinase
VLDYGETVYQEILKKLSSPSSGGKDSTVRGSENLYPAAGQVSWKERCRLLGTRPLTLWLTGLSAAGKSTIAYALERRLTDGGIPCYTLDGDNIRQGLNRDLGFSDADRSENIRRVAETARLINDAGLTVISAFISPFQADRAVAKSIIGPRYFREIYISTSLEVCRGRDPKGLYRRALAGEISRFTGIDSPYEVPENPDCSIDAGSESLASIIDRLMILFRA